MSALTILTYHSLDPSGSVVSVHPDLFADHMRAIADLGLRGVSLRGVVSHRRAHGTWPDRSVAITFDDGFANFADHALPALARHGFGATLFLVSGHVGGRNDWAPPPPGLGDLPMLTWARVAEVAAAGVEVGAHTRTHPDLRRLAPIEAESEIRASKSEIEDHTGLPVESFAYPYGTFDAHSADVARREFRAACTTVLRRAGADDPHLLPRVDAYYVRDSGALVRAVTGRLDGYLALRRLGRAVRSALPF